MFTKNLLDSTQTENQQKLKAEQNGIKLALITCVSINIIIMLNKYATKSKRNDLGLPLVIFVQAFLRTSENKTIRGQVSSELCLLNAILMEYTSSLFIS
jgi:hypothetical protein